MSEQITLLSLADIIGLEFECPKCQLKLLYTITPTLYDRLPRTCLNCGAEWVYENPNQHPSAPRTTVEILGVIHNLQKLATHQDVEAKVRLRIKDSTHNSGPNRKADEK
jgi:hypothetical protein